MPDTLNPGPKRILMVDDDPDTSEVMQRLLGGLGYDVRTADSVSSALAVCQSESIDVLISDIGLPDGTGHDLMRQLIAAGQADLKAIAISGFAMEQDVQESLQAGFRQHISKPVNLQRLRILLEQIVA